MARYRCERDADHARELDVSLKRETYTVRETDAEGAEAPREIRLDPARGPLRTVRVGDRVLEVGLVSSGDRWRLVIDGIEHDLTVKDARLAAVDRQRAALEAASGPTRVVAPIPGLVVRVLVAEGDEVAKDQPLLILDAMKLENEILAPRAGTVAALAVEPGQAVEKDQLLLSIG